MSDPKFNAKLTKSYALLARDLLVALDRKGPTMLEPLRRQLRTEPSDIIAVLGVLENASPAYVKQSGRNGPWRITKDGEEWVAAYRATAQAQRNQPDDDPVEVAISVARELHDIEAERDAALNAAQATIDARTGDVEAAARMLAEAEQARTTAVLRANQLCEPFEARIAAAKQRLAVLFGQGGAK